MATTIRECGDLKPGWLLRQMQKSVDEVETWPEWLKPECVKPKPRELSLEEISDLVAALDTVVGVYADPKNWYVDDYGSQCYLGEDYGVPGYQTAKRMIDWWRDRLIHSK